MSNRPRDAEKWSACLQVMVSENTQIKLKELSREAETTISGLCRKILDEHVQPNWKKNQTSRSC